MEGTRDQAERRTPWTASELVPRPSAHAGDKPDLPQLLRAATGSPKQTVGDLSVLPASLVATSEVGTRMYKPRLLDPHDAPDTWYPQLETAFILRIEDGFIGDHVIFDRDRYYSLGRWWLGDSWESYRHVSEVRHIEAGVSVSAWGGEAFQHFMLDALPKLAMVLDLLDAPGFENLQIVSHMHDAPAARWFWDKLDLTDRVVQKPMNSSSGFVVHADLALYPDFEPYLGTYGVWARNTLLPLQGRLGLLDPTDQDLVIYLDRPGVIRSVANVEEILTRLRDLLAGTGYELHRFNSSGDQQADMDLMRRARVLIGPHGGSFANIVFAQPGTHVVEFLPIYSLFSAGEDPRPYYWGLAQAAGCDYWTVEPTNFDFHNPGMHVDVDAVERTVAKILS
jgi:hypothetical protein